MKRDHLNQQLAKLGEFRVLTLRETPAFGKVEEPDAAEKYWRANIATDPRHNPDVESLIVLVMNTRREILGHATVATGTLDTLLCHPREVFRPALVANAHSVLVNCPRSYERPQSASCPWSSPLAFPEISSRRIAPR